MARELTPQEQMVFKELCIRAFYGVKVQTTDRWSGNLTHTLIGYRKAASKVYYFYTNEYGGEYEPAYLNSGCYDKILPYLRSLDTMTEQEYESIKPMLEGCTHRVSFDIKATYFKVDFIKTYKPELLDWLYAHHFNISLPKELYIEMPEEMYVK